MNSNDHLLFCDCLDLPLLNDIYIYGAYYSYLKKMEIIGINKPLLYDK